MPSFNFIVNFWSVNFIREKETGSVPRISERGKLYIKMWILTWRYGIYCPSPSHQPPRPVKHYCHLTGSCQISPKSTFLLNPILAFLSPVIPVSLEERQPGWVTATGRLCDGDQWFPDTGLRGHQIDFTWEQIQIWTQFFRGERDLLIFVTVSLKLKWSPF